MQWTEAKADLYFIEKINDTVEHKDPGTKRYTIDI